jgi:hypothetical protein
VAKFARTESFDKAVRKLSSQQLAELKDAALLLSKTIDEHGFQFPRGGPLDIHSYSGFRRPPAVWSIDWGRGRDGRALFTVEGDIVVWHFVGTHAQIERWQKAIGPTGLQT